MPNASLGDTDHDSATWTLRPTLGLLTQSITTKLRITERTQNRVVLTVDNRTTGASLTAMGDLTFREPHIDWSATIVSVTGLLKMVPQSVLRSHAETLIADVWCAIRARLEADERSANDR